MSVSNSSQSDTLQVKSSHSCKTNLYINCIKVLTYGRHRCTIRKYMGLNRQSLVQVQKLWKIYLESLIEKNEYVTFQTYSLSLLVKEKDE